MMYLGRRSILNKPWRVVCLVLLLCTLASAQHPGAPVVHPPVAPVHVSPPIYHAPALQAPVMRPPIMYAPITNSPRSGIISSPGRYGTSIVLPPVRPVRPIRPVQPALFIYAPGFFFADPFWRLNSCWYGGCDLVWPWTFAYTTVPSPGPANYVAQAPETQVYVYGGEREDFPQLMLKDGTIINETDYWVVDGQLHFKIIEAAGQKPVENSVPFDELDLQKTIDVNSARGFRFILRNEPFEECVRHHPDGPPPESTPKPE